MQEQQQEAISRGHGRDETLGIDPAIRVFGGATGSNSTGSVGSTFLRRRW